MVNKHSHHTGGGSTRKSEPLALVHSDVCGPMPTLSMGGASYFVTFIDDFSRKVWAYSLRRKDEVLSVFQRSITLVETQTGRRSSACVLTMVGSMSQSLSKISVT